MATVVLLAVVSAVLYTIAAVLSALQLQRHSDRLQGVSRGLLFAALLIHSITIGVTSVSTSGTLLQGPNILMLMSWTLAVVVAFLELASKRSYSYVAFTIPIVVVLMAIYGFMTIMDHGVELYNRVYNEWPLLVIHIIVMLVAIACFLVSAVVSAMYLYQNRNARRKSDAFLNMRMPALNTLRTVAGVAVAIGLPFFIVGILIGFSRYAVLIGVTMALGGGSVLYLVPRIVLSLVVLVTYIFYLTFKYVLPGRIPSVALAWISMVAGVMSVVLAVMSSVAVM